MKFFEAKGSWNWVDENNVFLGFEVDGNCCAIHGWYLTDEVPTSDKEPDAKFSQPKFDWKPWRFDPSFEARIDDGWMESEQEEK